MILSLASTEAEYQPQVCFALFGVIRNANLFGEPEIKNFLNACGSASGRPSNFGSGSDVPRKKVFHAASQVISEPITEGQDAA